MFNSTSYTNFNADQYFANNENNHGQDRRYTELELRQLWIDQLLTNQEAAQKEAQKLHPLAFLLNPRFFFANH